MIIVQYALYSGYQCTVYKYSMRYIYSTLYGYHGNRQQQQHQRQRP